MTVQKFLDFPYATHMKDHVLTSLDKTHYKNYLPPDVTVCNSNPLKYKYKEKLSYTGNVSKKQFDQFYEKHLSTGNLTGEMKSLYRTYHGYFQYIGIENAVHISHEKDTLVVECSIIFSESGSLQMASCDRDRHIKHAVLPDYYSCYTVTIDRDTYDTYLAANKLILGVDVILFLNNGLEDLNIPFQKNKFRGSASGARISKLPL